MHMHMVNSLFRQGLFPPNLLFFITHNPLHLFTNTLHIFLCIFI